MNYKLKVRADEHFTRRADRRFRTSPGIPFNDFYTDKPLKDCDFYNFNQPELFSEFDDLLDTITKDLSIKNQTVFTNLDSIISSLCLEIQFY